MIKYAQASVGYNLEGYINDKLSLGLGDLYMIAINNTIISGRKMINPTRPNFSILREMKRQ